MLFFRLWEQATATEYCYSPSTIGGCSDQTNWHGKTNYELGKSFCKGRNAK